MEFVAWIVMPLLLLGASTILTAEEASASLLARARIRRLVDMGRRGAAALETFADQPHRLHAAAAAGRAVAFASVGLAGWVFGSLMTETGTAWLAALSGLFSLAVGFSLADALPRAVAVHNPEGVALAFAPLARPLVAVGYALARTTSLPWQWAMVLGGARRPGLSPWASEDEFKTSAPEDEEAAREEAEEALLEAVSEFTEKVVREVMVPRPDMAALPDTASISEAIEIIEQRGYSRLPVYHETVDDIRGVLYAKDLLSAVGSGHSIKDITTISRAPYFVPETKPIDELFVEMRARTHIAIVADEHGGTAGLVTIEDLLEELVGEIFDEYDREEPLVQDEGDGRYRVDARLPIDDVNEVFGTGIDVDADTIGGVVSIIAGHIPEVGESFEVEGLRITVAEREGTRVRQLEIEPVGMPDDEESNDA